MWEEMNKRITERKNVLMKERDEWMNVWIKERINEERKN